MYSDKKNDTIDAWAAIIPFVLYILYNIKDNDDDLENHVCFSLC